MPTKSVHFFETQFQRQVNAGEFELNPFERLTLPYLKGEVLDLGCGLGNLALEAARTGCRVTALDGSPTGIARLRETAACLALPVAAHEADLGHWAGVTVQSVANASKKRAVHVAQASRLRVSKDAGERAWLLPPGFRRHYNHGLPLAGAPALHARKTLQHAEQSRASDRDYDSIVAIGLLMFFPRERAEALLADIVTHVRPGGVVALNVLTEGTTFLAMFEPGHCHLFAPGALKAAVPGWQVLAESVDRFPAPGGTEKVFETVIARKPPCP